MAAIYLMHSFQEHLLEWAQHLSLCSGIHTRVGPGFGFKSSRRS